MHGLSSISASWSRFKLKTKNCKPMGDHSHINNDTHRLPHILPYIFTPPTSAPNPCFCPNCHPKSYFCHTVQNFGNFSLKDKSAGIWEKGTQMPPIFYGFCHWKTPYFFALHTHVCLRGMLLPQTPSEAGKFCILETESSNLVNTFRCKFNKGDENKISVLQAPPTQLCIIWMNVIDDIQAIIHLVKHVRGYIL